MKNEMQKGFTLLFKQINKRIFNEFIIVCPTNIGLYVFTFQELYPRNMNMNNIKCVPTHALFILVELDPILTLYNIRKERITLHWEISVKQ